MNIYYQSDDGKLWHTEQDCLDRDEECRKAQVLSSLIRQEWGTIGSSDWNSPWAEFLEQRFSLHFDYEECLPLWDERHHLFRLVDLMRQAEAEG